MANVLANALMMAVGPVLACSLAPTPTASAMPFSNCDQVEAAGLAHLTAGEPGYRASLDRDGDGVACETGSSTSYSPPAAFVGGGWAVVAGSPSREQSDWSWSTYATQATAEAQALQNCAVKENAADCVVLASGPACVAVAWDMDEPLNRAHGGVGTSAQTAVNAAVAAAGPYANDPQARCSWDPNPTI
jgi:excalibur calcium-binding domain-containing protein/uncharacterized protein DUF4189